MNSVILPVAILVGVPCLIFAATRRAWIGIPLAILLGCFCLSWRMIYVEVHAPKSDLDVVFFISLLAWNAGLIAIYVILGIFVYWIRGRSNANK
jgi:hypothetical protein